MIHADKFLQKVIENSLTDAIKDRKGYFRLNIEGTSLIKAKRFLEKFGYSIINDNGFFEVVPDIIKELRK